MFSKLSNSWELVKASAGVLRADKELLVFPLFSGIAMILVVATFAVPMIFTGGFAPLEDGGPLTYVLVFLFYFCQYFVVVFFNTALVGAALIRLDGGNPTLGDGLRTAMGRLGAIVGWALLASTVGLLLQMARERSGALGRFVVGLFGLAWSLATFLVVPVLAVKGVGPIEAVKESARVLKKTWGEQIAGNLGLGAVFTVAYIAFAVLGGALMVGVSTTGLAIVIVPTAIILAALLLSLILIQAALSSIYTAALYRYATTGEIGAGFESKLLSEAFVRK